MSIAGSTAAVVMRRLRRNDFLTACSAHIKLGHIIQTQAGQAAMLRFLVSAAAVDVNDASTVPDTEVFIIPGGEEIGGRMADDADGITVRVLLSAATRPQMRVSRCSPGKPRTR